MNNEQYGLMLDDFDDKAEKIINLAEYMNKTFCSETAMNQQQKAHMKMAIVAGLWDTHRNGYKNGQAHGQALHQPNTFGE